MDRNAKLTLLSYLTVCLVWGSTYLAIKIGVMAMPFLLFAGIRFFVAGCIIIIVSKLMKWSFPINRNDYRTLFIAGLLLLFVSNGLICWAEQFIESSLTALLIASVPLFMALIEMVVPQENRVSPLGWVGLIIGFSGVAFLVSPHFSFDNQTLPAIMAVLLASFNWAAASIYLQRKTVSGSMLPNAGIQMFAAGSLFLVAAFFFGGISLTNIPAEGYGSLIYLIFIGSILAYTAFNYMLKTMPAAKAGTYAYINPVVAVILGALILQEAITAQNLIAAAITLGGVVIVQLSKTRPMPPKQLPKSA